MMLRKVSNAEVRDFWEKNPVAAAAISAEPGSRAFFEAFDALREAEDLEPYPYSNRMHGYESSAGKRVLDVGCGNGYVLAHYARHGAEVHGIDLTETALRLSRRRFEVAGLDGAFCLTDGKPSLTPTATSISSARWGCCTTSRTRGPWWRRFTGC